MPATDFICNTGEKTPITKCLNNCPNGSRCMFLPTLRAVAESLNRKIDKPTVTELLCGVRETYLKRTTDYAVNPLQQLYAVHGTAVHTIQENHTEGEMLSEERLADEITSGKFDLYGQIVDYGDNTLGDYKITSSYKLMKALDITRWMPLLEKFTRLVLKKVSLRQKRNGVLMVYAICWTGQFRLTTTAYFQNLKASRWII